MRKRTELLDCELALASKPGQGTTDGRGQDALRKAEASCVST